MALTLSNLLGFRDALITALSLGATEVTFNGRTVRYNSAGDILKAINYLDGEITKASGITSTRQIRVYTGKGLDALTDPWANWS
jgi:hypothetical protein